MNLEASNELAGSHDLTLTRPSRMIIAGEENNFAGARDGHFNDPRLIGPLLQTLSLFHVYDMNSATQDRVSVRLR